MNKEKLLAMFKDKKIQNYSYHIFFFIVFSFFIIFAIHPNLTTAFRLQKELQDLRLENKKSEEVILKIVNYQSLMEEYRDSLYVLDEAVPSSPEIAKVIEDISKTASDSGLTVKSLTVERIAFKEQAGEKPSETTGVGLDETILGVNTDSAAGTVEDTAIVDTELLDESVGAQDQPGLLSYTITLQGEATVTQITQFTNQILNQRRLKTYDSINLSSRDAESNIVINILVRTYYL